MGERWMAARSAFVEVIRHGLATRKACSDTCPSPPTWPFGDRRRRSRGNAVDGRPRSGRFCSSTKPSMPVATSVNGQGPWRARIATPLYVFWPVKCDRVARCLPTPRREILDPRAFVSCRHTTSGVLAASHARRRSRRTFSELMFQVTSFIGRGVVELEDGKLATASRRGKSIATCGGMAVFGSWRILPEAEDSASNLQRKNITRAPRAAVPSLHRGHCHGRLLARFALGRRRTPRGSCRSLSDAGARARHRRPGRSRFEGQSRAGSTGPRTLRRRRGSRIHDACSPTARRQHRRGRRRSGKTAAVAIIDMRFDGKRARGGPARGGGGRLPGNRHLRSRRRLTRRGGVDGANLSRGVTYADVYPGIDVVFYGTPAARARIRPRRRPRAADPRRIAFRFGVVSTGSRSTPKGDLLLRSPWTHAGVSPACRLSGDRRPTPVRPPSATRCVLMAESAFELAATTGRHPLVVDPVLELSTNFWGATGRWR